MKMYNLPISAFLASLLLSAAEAVPTYEGAWDTIRVYTHCWDDDGRDGFSSAQEAYIADRSAMHVTEKRHNTVTYPSPGSEAGMRSAADSLFALNPNTKYLMYLNAIVTFEDIFKTADNRMNTHPSDFFYTETNHPSWPGEWGNDLSRQSCRNWWRNVAVNTCNASAMTGVFMDALPKVTSAGLLSDAHLLMDDVRNQGLFLIYNGYFTNGAGGLLAASDTLTHADGVFVEAFFSGNCDTTQRRVDLMDALLSIPSNKYIVCRGNEESGDSEDGMGNVVEPDGGSFKFALACHLVLANDFTYFKYGGYTGTEDLVDRPEYTKELGNPDPVGYPPVKNGSKYIRYFDSAKVVVNMDGTDTRINWAWSP